MSTHIGKIARLPRNIREELNQRLDQGEDAGKILPWLNAIPEVKNTLASEFGGLPINAQNLSNWRKGGYRGWLKQQERRQMVKDLTQNAAELEADANGVEIANHLSAVLMADFAAAALAALEEIKNPAERCVREQEILATLCKVRRQDNLAGKLALERERRAQEQAKAAKAAADWQERGREMAPWLTGFRRFWMKDCFEHPGLYSQWQGMVEADSLLRDAGKNPPRDPVAN